MKILVDQNLPRSLAAALVKAGYDAIHVSVLGLEAASDPEIFQACREQKRVLVTADKRLTKFLVADRATDPSIVIVRGTLRTRGIVELVSARAEHLGQTIAERGSAVFSIAPDQPTRVRLLPLD